VNGSFNLTHAPASKITEPPFKCATGYGGQRVEVCHARLQETVLDIEMYLGVSASDC
jgi:hypothetical protein